MIFFLSVREGAELGGAGRQRSVDLWGDTAAGWLTWGTGRRANWIVNLSKQ